MPLAVSATTRIEPMSAGSTNVITWSTNCSSRSCSVRVPHVDAGADRPPSSTGSATALHLGEAGVDADRTGPGEAQLDAVVLRPGCATR